MADTKLQDEVTQITAFNGDERLYAVNGVGGTPSDGWISPSDLIALASTPMPWGASGTPTLVAPPHAVGQSAVVLAQDRLYCVPFNVQSRRTFTSIGVQTSGAVVGAARLGIYNTRDKNTLLPGTLVTDAGTVDTSVTNSDKFITSLSIDLNPGWYFFAVVCNAAASLRSTSGTKPSPMGAFLFGSGFSTIDYVYRSFTYAALQADETASTFTAGANSAPYGFLR